MLVAKVLYVGLAPVYFCKMLTFKEDIVCCPQYPWAMNHYVHSHDFGTLELQLMHRCTLHIEIEIDVLS